jgi:transcriptional regulator of arginine metabolism
MNSKIKRQNRIKEILKKNNISSHEELVTILAEEGVQITQATLSRDFAELGVVRTFTDSGIRYVINSDEWGNQISKLIGFEILNVAHNESLVVLRTIAGRATGVAHYIDRMNRAEILGTVGGVDTVMIIPDSIGNIPKIIEMIKKMIQT